MRQLSSQLVPVFVGICALVTFSACFEESAADFGERSSETIPAEVAPAGQEAPPLEETARPKLVVDLHLDTVTEMVEKNITWNDRQLEASLPELLEAGVNVVVQAAWIPRGDPQPRGTGIGKIRRIRNMVRQSKGRAALVTGPDQLERVVRDGRLAVVIALEGGTALIKEEETLREFRSLGLSMLGLTWSESSAFADSSASPRAGAAGGLTPAGRKMVTLANDLGLILDVSHMSDRATADTLALSRAPVVASHSNARDLCDVPRNLSDTLLSGIAAKGGLVGVMFHGPFVVQGRQASRSDVAAQIRGLVDRVGAEHVGIGSDWDGKIKTPRDLQGPTDLKALRSDLSGAGLTSEQLEGIWGENFLRVWRSVQAARVSSD
jgi:membrane dipeptidase